MTLDKIAETQQQEIVQESVSKPGSMAERIVQSEDNEEYDIEASASAQQAFGTTSGKEKLGFSERPPTAAEKGLAHRLAEELRKAQQHSPRKRVITHLAPPGRLHGRNAMQQHAQQVLGQDVIARPWQRSKKEVVPGPPLKVGIIVDLSGSMGVSQAPVASAAWVIASAAHHLVDGGDVACVGFGKNLYPIIKPGDIPQKLTIWRAEARQHNIAGALMALDYSLRLSVGKRDYKLVVIISDGNFGPEEISKGKDVFDRLLSKNTQFLWINFGDELPKTFSGLDGGVIPVSEPELLIEQIGRLARLGLIRRR